MDIAYGVSLPSIFTVIYNFYSKYVQGRLLGLCDFYVIFVRSTFVGSAWLFVFFIPATTTNDLRLRRSFYCRFYPLQLFSYLNSWERASIFPFECSVLNKGTTGTIFITSLVWCCPWLGIEPGTSRTQSTSTIPLGYRGGGVEIQWDWDSFKYN